MYLRAVVMIASWYWRSVPGSASALGAAGAAVGDPPGSAFAAGALGALGAAEGLAVDSLEGAALGAGAAVGAAGAVGAALATGVGFATGVGAGVGAGLATGVGSVGSRSAFVGGSAAVSAGRKAILRGTDLAAEALEASVADIEYRAGRFAISGTDRGIDWASLAARQPDRVIRVAATESPSQPSWPNGAMVAEVEIDPDTGEVEVASIASVDDVGRIINHMIVEGQIHGGIAQGIGQALYEHARYDASSGQLLTGSLMDYCVPRADQMPALTNLFEESVPCKTNLLGVKGCGELGTIGSVPAVVHAVLDALADRGVKHLEMPFTPEKVWKALHGRGV